MSKCVIVTNFAAIGQSMIEISRFFEFQDAAIRHLGFLNIQNFNGRQGYEGEHASSCKISRQSVKPLRRYGNFSIFQDGGRRHLRFLNI